MNLRDTAARIVELARKAGAAEATASVGRGESSSVTHRDGQLESFEESRTLTASIELLVDDRYSTHGTSDLRPEALAEFVARAVEATRFLEPDPDRRLPDRAMMGTIPAGPLDAFDPARDAVRGDDRRALAAELEAACRDRAGGLALRSVTASVWDGASERAVVASNGFSMSWATTGFGRAASVSVEDEDGRLPEAYNAFQARHLGDLPGVDFIVDDVLARARARLGSGPTASGRYPMILENRVVGRILGMILGPISGTAIYERRSCLADRLGERIAAEGLSLVDDPTIPRALGSRPCDGDGLPSRRRAILDEGRLACFLLDVYNARRLGREPTSGSVGNLVVPAGPRDPAAIAAELDRAVRVEGFLGGNANAATGDFSFGITGTLLERGRPVAALGEMNVSGNLLDLLPRFREAASDTWTWSAWRAPTLLFDDVQFSGT